MTAPRGLLGRLRPRSFRAWTAIGIIGSLAIIFLVQAVLGQMLDAQARRGVDDTLQRQASAVLAEVARAPLSDRDAAARRAAALLPDTRVLVSDGGDTVFWSQPSGATYARGEAGNGRLRVTLERVDPISGVDRGLVLSATALGLGVTGLVVWLVSGSLALRLRERLRRLSDSAERIAGGHLDERVAVTDDEVGRVAEVFNRMAGQLERNDVRQRDFLADVAHELRTPVTAIEGFAMALEDGTARSDEDREEAAAFIRQEAARMRDLVREFQQLTWLDLDPPVRAVPVDLAELARDTLARLAGAARERDVTLNAPVGVVQAVTDPDHVGTILSNLVTNAVKATRPGGSVTVGVRAVGGDAVLTVTDTGVGIAPEHLPMLFDRLFRLEASRVRAGDGGSGLGLSIVKRLTVLLGGRVSVSSQVGVGSEFTVWLLGAAARSRRDAHAQATR